MIYADARVGVWVSWSQYEFLIRPTVQLRRAPIGASGPHRASDWVIPAEKQKK